MMAVDVFLVVPFFNVMSTYIIGSGLVVSMLDYQVFSIIGVVVCSIPILVLFFTLVDSLNTIVFRVRL